MTSFMISQSQVDQEFGSNILEKKEQNESEEVIIRVCVKGDLFCVEAELDRKMSHAQFIDLIRSEICFVLGLKHMPWL